MRFSPDTDEHFCVKCHATGRLPVVEGDAYCPQCGELVWTVRPVVHGEAMAPDYRLPIRVHRPPLRLKGRWLARLCVFCFRPVVRRWLNWREKRCNLEIEKKLKQLQSCNSRVEYEKVIGQPVATVTGKGTGSILPGGLVVDSPDLIEYYDSRGCTIGLHFKNDKIQKIHGSMKLTALYIEFHSTD